MFGEPQAGIYKITHIPSGRIYIGQSTNILMRIMEHYRDLLRGSHTAKAMQADFAKDGPGMFQVEVVERCASEPGLLLMREAHWIDTLGTLDPAVGYNTTIARLDQEQATRHTERVSQRVSTEYKRRFERDKLAYPDTCKHCHGLGTIGQNRRVCPACRGSRKIPTAFSYALTRLRFDLNVSKLSDEDVDRARHTALAQLLEYFPSPADLCQGNPELFRSLQDVDVLADGTAINS